MGCFKLKEVIDEVNRMINESPLGTVLKAFNDLVDEAIEKSGVGKIFDAIEALAAQYCQLNLGVFPDILPTVNHQLKGLTDMQKAAKDNMNSLIGGVMSMSDLLSGPELPTLPGMCGFDAEMDDSERRLLLADARQLANPETKSEKKWLSQDRTMLSKPGHIIAKLRFRVERFLVLKLFSNCKNGTAQAARHNEGDGKKNRRQQKWVFG